MWCIVVAAGSGRRYGALKQFEDLAGARVIDRSVRIAAAACDGVVVVLPAAVFDRPDASVPGADVVVPGGATRAASVRAGLAAVPDSASVVLVHDAARPLASPELYARVIAAVRSGAAAVVPAVAVVDTIRGVDGGVVDRDALRAAQTPQGFDATVLREVHASAPEATDDAGLVEAAGGRVLLVEGERRNLKLTEPEDRAIAATLLATHEPGETSSMGLRIGNGFDVHRFSEDPSRVLVLGGVVFEGETALHGHSDADVVAHAVGEALLGAVGLGDLGSHFPDTDERWRGVDSLELLDEIVRMVRVEGWQPVNVDCSVIAERPKLAARRDEMQRNLSARVGAPVTVKGRRAEGIGGLGRSEGIACLASALLESIADAPQASAPAATAPVAGHQAARTTTDDDGAGATT